MDKSVKERDWGGARRDAGRHVVLSTIPFCKQMPLLEDKTRDLNIFSVDVSFHILLLLWSSNHSECDLNKDFYKICPYIQIIYFICCSTENQWSEGKIGCVGVTKMPNLLLPKELAKPVLSICYFCLLSWLILMPWHCLLCFMGNHREQRF